MQYYSVDPPSPWLAGYIGEEPSYFPCAECERELPIAGFLGDGPEYEHVALLNKGTAEKPRWFNAFLCRGCFDIRLKRGSDGQNNADAGGLSDAGPRTRGRRSK
jgi:hypothetical protein